MVIAILATSLNEKKPVDNLNLSTLSIKGSNILSIINVRNLISYFISILIKVSKSTVEKLKMFLYVSSNSLTRANSRISLLILFALTFSFSSLYIFLKLSGSINESLRLTKSFIVVTPSKLFKILNKLSLNLKSTNPLTISFNLLTSSNSVLLISSSKELNHFSLRYLFLYVFKNSIGSSFFNKILK